MDVCAGSYNDKHPEICHGEGPNSCPICELKAELSEVTKEKDKAVGDLEVLKEAHVLVTDNLETLRAKIKGAGWALEDVPEVKS